MSIPNFLPREAYYLANVALDLDANAYCTVAELTALVRKSTSDDGVLKRVRTLNHVNVNELCAKLEGAGEGFVQAFAGMMSEVRSSPYVFARDGFLSRSLVDRLGLVKPQRPVAWGVCFTRNETYHFSELVLHHPRRIALGLDCGVTLEKAVGHMAMLANNLWDLSGSRPRCDARILDWQVDVAYVIAAKSGLRYFRVESAICGRPDRLCSLEWHEVASEIDDKELVGLTIAGVNAPDLHPAAASAP